MKQQAAHRARRCGVPGGGVFAPLISLPIVGELNYFGNGKGDGVFVLIPAVTAFGLVAAHYVQGGVGHRDDQRRLIGYTFFQFVSRMSKVKGDSSASDPGRWLAAFRESRLSLFKCNGAGATDRRRGDVGDQRRWKTWKTGRPMENEHATIYTAAASKTAF